MKTDLTKSTEQAPARADQPPFAVRPRVDVFENEAEYLVVADVPGVARDALDVRFEDGELRLEARRAGATAGQPIAEEYRIGDYRRAFAMPEGIDADRIDAELVNGVLKVHLPKSSAKRPRRIDIRSS